MVKPVKCVAEKIGKFVAGMRFFVLVPIIGLAIAAVVLFVKGSIDCSSLPGRHSALYHITWVL